MDKIPSEIVSRFTKAHSEVQKIFDSALEGSKSEPLGNIRLKYVSCPPILTEYERAQSICFVTRYEALPVIEEVNIHEIKGKYFLQSYESIRHAINEYRPIIFNQKDSVYFGRIHKLCRQKLSNSDPSKDLCVSVVNIEGKDVTAKFIENLDANCKAIKIILGKSEFNYIYNGILQHSDHKFTKQFLQQYVSGEINYVLLKHSQLLWKIKELLYWHYMLLNSITAPKLGSL